MMLSMFGLTLFVGWFLSASKYVDVEGFRTKTRFLWHRMKSMIINIYIDGSYLVFRSTEAGSTQNTDHTIQNNLLLLLSEKRIESMGSRG